MRRKIPSNQQVEKDYNVLKSYKRVSDKYGVSRQRIYQIINGYGNTGKNGRLKKYKKSGFFKEKCNLCKKKSPVVLHHKDFNNQNDDISNLEPLCYDCHIKRHQGKSIKKEPEIRMIKNTEKYITVKDAAQLLRVTSQTVKKYIKTGILEGRKFPDNKMGRWYINKLSIPTFLRNGQEN